MCLFGANVNYIWKIGLILFALFLVAVGLTIFCWPSKEPEKNNQAIIPSALAIKQVRHLHFGDSGWVTESAIRIDNNSRIWIMRDVEVKKEKSASNNVKVTFSEKGFCIEVSEKSRWRLGDGRIEWASYPVMEIKIYKDEM